MADTNVLRMVMLEEYDRLSRTISLIEQEIAGLPIGYISKKKIRGREAFYLQWRDGSKIKSKYIKADDIDDMTERIARRRELQESLKGFKKDRSDIEKVLGPKYIKEHIREVI